MVKKRAIVSWIIVLVASTILIVVGILMVVSFPLEPGCRSAVIPDGVSCEMNVMLCIGLLLVSAGNGLFFTKLITDLYFFDVKREE